MERQNQLAVLKVSGTDACGFLQGQLTNDVSLAAEGWQLSAYCYPKGRVLALFSLWREEDDIYLVLDKSLSESIIKRLRMYVMRSDVTIEVLSDAQCFASIDEPSDASHTLGSIQHTKSYVELGYGNSTLRISMNGDTKAEQGSTWSKSLILAGIPQINSNNSELFVPQMINLDILDGINFKKGCYTGQEIVARMHYLGKLKQRMLRLNILTPAREGLLDASKVMSQDGKTLGTIVNHIDGCDSLLAVLRTEDINTNTVITTPSGTELAVAEHQPYTLDSKDKATD